MPNARHAARNQAPMPAVTRSPSGTRDVFTVGRPSTPAAERSESATEVDQPSARRPAMTWSAGHDRSIGHDRSADHD
ncbi:hypothetical protein HII36_31975 [Nonomuraea sp. NN258]|uniref:hypothetical protein n=1 Tax=Nonomuraea antri TaxID=2730852 RepID=UPI0015690B29|nr:hypothetical protein [Nonomuraea antri]NRQ36419.1 hypothetical protein [Nonomuraea antri]